MTALHSQVQQLQDFFQDDKTKNTKVNYLKLIMNNIEQQIMNQKRVINGRYLILQKISEGGFGYIHKGVDLKNNNKQIVVKIEKSNINDESLKKEYQIYKKLGKVQIQDELNKEKQQFKQNHNNNHQKFLITKFNNDIESLESTNSIKKGNISNYFFGENIYNNVDLKNNGMDEILEDQNNVISQQNEETCESSNQQQTFIQNQNCYNKEYSIQGLDFYNQQQQNDQQQNNNNQFQYNNQNQFQIYDYSTDQETGEQFLVMDFLQGHNLKEQQKLELDNKFSEYDAAVIAVQVLEQIEYIHSKGIIHCDIKPENILIQKKIDNHKVRFNQNEEDFQINLIDFGLSQLFLNENGTHVEFQIHPKIQGTIKYLSICASMGYQQSRRDDLESLGYILSYMLNGQLPWERKNFHKMINFEDKQEEKFYYTKRTEQIKLGTQSCDLFENFNQCFVDYLNYCKNLDFDEQPNYKYLINLFKNYIKDTLKDNTYSLNKSIDLHDETIYQHKSENQITSSNSNESNEDKNNCNKNISHYQIQLNEINEINTYKPQEYLQKKKYSLQNVINFKKQQQGEILNKNTELNDLQNNLFKLKEQNNENSNDLQKNILKISSYYQIRNNERQQYQ
ncbi:Protein kinase-like domain [Pseudocohnilembus persalinus]|uniref:Casein kinase I n=1 Tax=Pseudocohnilembus persalinus TaxID=266149 RepID=A0A0V0Q8X4_PSEPJ|nr:Protein kinase-like domain [Pseudocohnilembus persalinus]|eukprot:KRW98484.1 Protein kinase-like domain [Pseudocohnilembus persalinus]